MIVDVATPSAVTGPVPVIVEVVGLGTATTPKVRAAVP